MREEDLQDVLLVRAFEEADPRGVLLPLAARAEATRQARDGNAAEAGTPDEEIVVTRARRLATSLGDRLALARNTLRSPGLGDGTTLVVSAGALILGLTTNALGPAREINLLAVPLLTLLGWNVLVYAAMVVAAVWKRTDPASRGSTFAGALLDLEARWRRRAMVSVGKRGEESSRVAAEAWLGFLASWRRAAGDLMASRARRTLHIAAAALAAGVVGGMYLRGIAFEYAATWESTLLDATDVQTLLNTVLSPAAALTGIAVPDVTRLDVSGAAPWIHLYAATAGLVIFLPRSSLALWETWRSARMTSRLEVDLEDRYFRRTLTEGAGRAHTVEAIPYSFAPRSESLDRLKLALYETFGPRVEIRVREPLAYGAEADEVLRDTVTRSAESGPSCVVAWFNMAQSPEAEVHGTFLEELKAGLPPGGQLLAVLDPTGFRGRPDGDERWDERRAAWRRVVGEHGLDVAISDPEDTDLPESLSPALWSARE